ncbi:polysaccharide biosynthesis tyrosine autokinase [Demequina lutea]|uniref:non-specific protein-tyrosine kinase n=1 Tax=Demequina lutea TaxID=431489 RepID=A0A7Y9ZBP2_9MICO|nr:polysaccharide biosynthesis tyrosine autokinase [Demequina lutea]NYI40391.1 capsular exopolysaccharide synthesis family protein [Demequina lutea]
MELHDYIRILHKNWLIIVVTTVVAVAAATAYSLLAPPVYTANAKVFVSTSSVDSTADLASGNSFTQQRVHTYADLVKTAAVLQPTIDKLKLPLSVEQLRPAVSATAPLNTTVIDITVTYGDAVYATQLATGVAQQLATVVEKLETTNSVQGSPVRLKVVQEAEVPGAPSSPKKTLDVALGLLLGLAAGVGIALLRSTLDTRIHNEKDLERITDVPLLGGIVFDRNAKTRPLIIHADPHSPRAESFRTLRTNLQFLDVGRPERAFVITSAMPSEGKSTTVVNLAIALAETGTSVLLVDADLRRPRVEQYLGIEGGVGLTDVIIGRVTASDAIQRWGTTSLFVLASGPIPPNPSELLGSSTMSTLIGSLASEFDVVLFDAPPLLPVTDAAILARLVGGCVVVAASGKTRSTQLGAALDALVTVGAPQSGIVLTMLPTSGPDSYGYGRYGYGYSEPGATPQRGKAKR